ncbi:MAG: hypothetical protein ABSC36_02935 [Gaiellaceae bacterium]|jgi:flagellar capping protein FliD
MKKHLSKKRVVLAAIVVVALAIASGVAFAYWTSSGSGTASAAAAAGSAGVSVTQVGTVSNLVPGGTAQAVDFKITNGQSVKQYISSVAVSISSVTAPNSDGSHPCSSADFTLVQPNAVNADLAPGDTTFQPSGASIAMKDTASNQDGCKGATVNLAFSAS